MNRHEKEFSIILESGKRIGEISWWGYEAIKLRLADRTWYTPDFFVIPTHLEFFVIPTHLEAGLRVSDSPKFIEIKGFKRDDAMVKFKCAREMFPWASFEMWSREGGSWNRIM
jgi:hypothetical protein